MLLLDLVQSKNKCLEYFLDVSKRFLKACEQGDFSSLDSFCIERDSALKFIAYIDSKIGVTPIGTDLSDREQIIADFRILEQKRKELVSEIILTDQAITQKIESERSATQSEIVKSEKAAEKISKFKSGLTPVQGETLDREV